MREDTLKPTPIPQETGETTGQSSGTASDSIATQTEMSDLNSEATIAPTSADESENTLGTTSGENWKRNSLGLKRWHNITLIICTLFFAVLWILAVCSFLDIWVVRVAAGILGLVGAGMRFGAHGQDAINWRFIDLAGKFLAYYAAFTLLFFVGVG